MSLLPFLLSTVLSFPLGAPARAPEVEDPALQTVPISTSGRISSVHETRPFALIGATWDDPGARLATTVSVRARSAATGAWSAWQELESDGRAPVEPGSTDRAERGRTDPAWVDTSTAVQARYTGPAPAGLRLDLINPDVEVPPTADPALEAAPDPATDPAAEAAPEAATGAATEAAPGATGRAAALPPRPVPAYISRARWGANESIVKNAPEYTPSIKAFFVHHTATTNSYRCADSARIIRGIQAFHVRSNGWNDIGYNFLVDKCGTLFEGRRGGVANNVLGAHTLGFNSYSSAIAVLGNYDGAGAPPAARNVVARVAAYKLGMYGAAPAGKVALISSGSDLYRRGTRVTLNVISGHRDTNQTTCPGAVLYGQLTSIRRVAAAAPAGLRLLRMYGATANGPTYYTRGLVRPYWALSTPSSMLNRMDVYVDGRLYTTGTSTARIAALRLAPGRHTVTIIAVHLNGRTTRLERSVFADVTPPTFTMGPALVLGTGSLRSTVPVRLGWNLSDPGGIRFQGLSSPRPVVLGTARRTLISAAAPNRATVWAIKTTDRAGNTAVGTVRRTPAIVSDAAGTRTGSWFTLRNPAYLSGTASQSGGTGATIAWTVTGRGVSLAVSRTRASGTATIYLDGVRVGALNLRSAATVNRLAVWARNWGTDGTHTIKIVSTGAIVMDGLVVNR